MKSADILLKAFIPFPFSQLDLAWIRFSHFPLSSNYGTHKRIDPLFSFQPGFSLSVSVLINENHAYMNVFGNMLIITRSLSTFIGFFTHTLYLPGKPAALTESPEQPTSIQSA